MNNQRGIFITNVLSKFLERIIHIRETNFMERDLRTPKLECGEKSIYDNLFTLLTIIDDNKNHKKNTYILFADAEKCFDRLWLSDA